MGRGAWMAVGVGNRKKFGCESSYVRFYCIEFMFRKSENGNIGRSISYL